MAILDKVVKSYAQALLSIVEEKSVDALSKTKNDMVGILSYMRYTSLSEFLRSPYILKDDKFEVIEWVFGPKFFKEVQALCPPGQDYVGKDKTEKEPLTFAADVLASPVRNTTFCFLSLLLDRGIIGFVDKIAEKYLELDRIRRKVAIAIFTIPYTEKLFIDLRMKAKIDNLLNLLVSSTNWRGKFENIEKLEYKFESNPLLIAGFTVQVNTTVMDCSVSGEFRRLQKKLGVEKPNHRFYKRGMRSKLCNVYYTQ